VGNAHGQIKKLSITLLSNVSSKLFPHNTAVDFTNDLASTILKSEDIDSLGVRIKSIYLSKYSEINEDGRKIKHYEPLNILLSGVQGQRVNDYTLPVLAVANVRKACDEAKGGKNKYCHVSFDRAPIIALNQSVINRLRIQLTTNSGEKYPLWNNGLIVPTVIELEILSMSEESDFTITCMSHGSNSLYYESNQLTKFTCNLGRYVDLASWEVGLQSISLPPFLRKGEKMIMKWIYNEGEERPDERDSAWSVVEVELKNQFNKREDIFDEITRQMSFTPNNTNTDGSEKIEFYQTDEGEWQLKNNVVNTTVHLYCNPPMAEIMGIGEWNILRSNQENDTHITTLPPEVSASHLIQTPEIAFLYTSVVKENIVGDQSVNLLAVIPMNNFLGDNLPDKGASIYEPKNILFHEVKEGQYVQINFELRRADGSPFVLLPSLSSEYNRTSGGCVVTLHFKPKEINSYTYKLTEKLSLANVRKRRSADNGEDQLPGKKIKYLAHDVLNHS